MSNCAIRMGIGVINFKFNLKDAVYSIPKDTISAELPVRIKGVNPCSNMGGGIILGRNIHPACGMYCAA